MTKRRWTTSPQSMSTESATEFNYYYYFFFTLGINDPEGFEKKVRLLENGSGHYSVQSVPKES